LHDNTGLFYALNSGVSVQCVFIFDKNILDRLEDKYDKRVIFIQRQLEELNSQLITYGSKLLVEYGDPLHVWKKLATQYTIKAVYANGDYEPYAVSRDKTIAAFLNSSGIPFNIYKDQVVFEKHEVCKDDGTPYAMYTPYSKRWKSALKKDSFKAYNSETHAANFLKSEPKSLPPLSKIGFEDAVVKFPPKILKDEILHEYAAHRDIPSLNATSRLSIHLRFGTISIRELFRTAWGVSEKWTNELIWREFYMNILWHFPHVVDGAFKPAYDRLEWYKDEKGFDAWCEGRTGYPIVDAGMRELNETGFMHNRVRMITATFLCKYLLIDWRWGEAYFAKKLLDFDLAANNGGWQWCAGTGVDSTPYFRIFSMDSQTKRFDPEYEYIKRWIPEFNSDDYPEPIVDYTIARARCLDFYKNGLKEK
jgi:deoxyribodipyrimidine photo-lyase